MVRLRYGCDQPCARPLTASLSRCRHPCHAQGTYFLVTDFSALLPAGSTEDDVQVRPAGCRRCAPTGGCREWPQAAARSRSASTLLEPPAAAQQSIPPPLLNLQLCYRLTKEAGVTLIPVSAFYADKETAPRTLVRFVFWCVGRVRPLLHLPSRKDVQFHLAA